MRNCTICGHCGGTFYTEIRWINHLNDMILEVWILLLFHLLLSYFHPKINSWMYIYAVKLCFMKFLSLYWWPAPLLCFSHIYKIHVKLLHFVRNVQSLDTLNLKANLQTNCDNGLWCWMLSLIKVPLWQVASNINKCYIVYQYNVKCHKT